MPSRFADLLKPREGMVGHTLQLDARRQFPDVVKKSPFVLRRGGTPIPRSGDLVVIGIADYSLIDLTLLDDIAEVVRQGASEKIEIFNAPECAGLAEFESLIPGIDSYNQTPIAAVWQDGFLVHQSCGSFALDYLSRRYGVRLDRK